MTDSKSTFATEDDAVQFTGAGMIAIERQRQVRDEGWTAEHDDAHGDHGSLAEAAATYATYASGDYGMVTPGGSTPSSWPWEARFWKPACPIRMLVKAGALIAAEIDRRLRAGEKP